MNEFWRCKKFFSNFSIKCILRTQHKMADKLAHGDMNSPSAILYVNSIPLFQLSESVDTSYLTVVIVVKKTSMCVTKECEHALATVYLSGESLKDKVATSCSEVFYR